MEVQAIINMAQVSVQDMLEDTDISNSDIYDLLRTVNNMTKEILGPGNREATLLNHEELQEAQNVDIYNLLMEHKDNIQALKDKISSNNVFPRVPSFPDRVTKFNLRPAKKADVETLLKQGQRLGNGAFGVVYKVKYNGQIVALKHINQKSHKGNRNVM